MRTARRIALSIVVVLLLVVVAGYLLPNEWNVSRSVVIDAPPAQIHPWVSNLRQWSQWASWGEAADALEYTYAGPEQGEGAVQAWSGDDGGHGRLEIVRSDPDEGVWLEERIQADEVNAHGSITYDRLREGTRVTWKDQGTLPAFLGGYFKPIMEERLGEHFEQALQRLQERVESEAHPEAADTDAPAPAGTQDAGVARDAGERAGERSSHHDVE